VLDVAARDVVARWRRPDALPGRIARRRWRGTRRGGGAAPDGLYAFRIHASGQPLFPAGRFRLHGHRFPVRGEHGTRGAIGDFGAPRADGRVHEGFDVTAACGTPLLALRAGTVTRRGYDPQLYGNYVEVNARDSALKYFYAHMLAPAREAAGDRVLTGERLGKVGLTGNADGTPCHLHVEIRRSGRLLDPEPRLARWDRYG
jgi:murein DD-endopeptidase MepM/ murein hydrolase activator NlpD